MSGRDPVGDARQKLDGLPPRSAPVLECAAVYELGNDEQSPLNVPGVVDREDVRMVE